MQSTDREILLEINGRLIRLESRMDKLESRVDVIERRLDRLETRTEDLQTSVYWIFAGISVVIGMIALLNYGHNQESSRPAKDTRESDT